MNLDSIHTISDLLDATKALIKLNPSQWDYLVDTYTIARDEIRDGESESNEVETAITHIQEMVDDGKIILNVLNEK